MPATALADWLRRMDDDALAALLRARPDLAVPTPADSTVLAIRAGIPASVARTCEDLDKFALAVLTAAVVGGGDHRPVPRQDVTRLLGPEVPSGRVTRALRTLRRRALVWGADDALIVVPAARDVLGPHPGGLGHVAADLQDVDLGSVLAELSEQELRVLQALAAGPPVGQTRDAATTLPLHRTRTPVQRLLARGLLRRIDNDHVELPAQVGIVLRGDHPLGTLELDAPRLSLHPRDPGTVDSTGAGAVLDLLRHTDNLLAEWSREPPSVLRSGGLGVRDLRRTARQLEVEEPTVILLAEVTVAAGLVTSIEDGTVGQLWLPTVTADAWCLARPGQRWAALACAWLDLPRLPGLAGTRDERDRPLAALADELRRPSAAAVRRRVLEALAELEADRGIRHHEELAAVLAWRAPRQGGRLRDEAVRWTVEEATTLGVVALGALTSAGRALLTQGASSAASTLTQALPEPVDHVLVQADRTVVAPGPLTTELAAELALLADVESTGGATVYRITDTTVRRALDAGRSAADLHELLRTRSRTPIPQSLSYLIDDVARRHGRLRAGSVASFLRCDDEGLLAELQTHPVARHCGLRRIAPTVLVSGKPLSELLSELRTAGFSPVAEGADGQMVALTSGARRAPVRPRPNQRPLLPPVLSDEQLSALVHRIRAGDLTAEPDRMIGPR